MNFAQRTLRGLFVALVAFVGIHLVVPDAAQAQAPDREFTIAVGETLTFNARSVNRVTVGLPEVADVQPTDDRRQLLLTGKSRGVTTVNLYSSQGQKTLLIRVVGVNPVSLAQEVRKILGEGSGVDVRIVKGRVLLEGEVSSDVFKQKIQKLTDVYPQQILNFTTFREAFVQGAKMVAVDVDFIQMSVTNQDDIGVNWGQFLGGNVSAGTGDVPLFYEQEGLDSGVQPGQDGNLLSKPTALTGGSGLNSYWSLVGNLNVTLDFLSDHGLIKTVQQGTIVTEAGKQATYHSGGTLLVKLESFGGAQLERVPFGVDIKVKPVVDFQNQVKLDISVELSRLDFANSVGDLPSLLDTEIETTVNMKQGQSVLITSQNNNETTSNESGWFMLQKIPIVGWLFKSRNHVDRKLDNALFVTPRIYEAGSDYHKTLVKGVFDDLLDAGVEPDDLPELSNEPGNQQGDVEAGSQGGDQ